MTRINPRQIDFLTTNVGRGHRFYLEGLHCAVNELSPDIKTNLYHAAEVSGTIARPGWLLINSLYRRGSSSDWFGSLYNRIRSGSDPNGDSAALRLFGSGLRRWWKQCGNPLVVDHPLLVKLLYSLSDRPELIYMHGEMVAPSESLVTDADLTIVPTVKVKNNFIGAGVSEDALAISGLCLERSLVPLVQQARVSRLERITTSAPLTGAFFSSGAEPAEHCAMIAQAVRSCINAGHNAIVFATSDGRLANAIYDAGLNTESRAHITLCSTIPQEESHLASLYHEIDYFVAPAHERTNWAIGAGLPFFILEPCFGSFAPLNRELALDSARAKLIENQDDASNFGVHLDELRKSGELQEMNGADRAKSPDGVDGFNQSAKQLLQRLTEPK